jgi:uncharacterized membrane protein YdjX (TVP38/TMEM64 family)
VVSKILKKNFLSFAITGAILLGIYLIGKNIPQNQILSCVQDAGVFAPLIFILLTLTTYVIAPLSGTPFLLVGFVVFQENVVILTTTAAIMASVINFLLAKKFGRQIVIKIVGQEEIHKVDKFMANYGFVSVFLSRIFLGMFHDVVSYLSGLTNLRFWPYFLASTLGMIPGNLLIYFLSQKIDSPLIYISFLVILGYSLFLVALIYKKLRRRQTNISPGLLSKLPKKNLKKSLRN